MRETDEAIMSWSKRFSASAGPGAERRLALSALINAAEENGPQPGPSSPGAVLLLDLRSLNEF